MPVLAQAGGRTKCHYAQGTEHKRGLFLVTPFLASSTHVPALGVTHSSTQDSSQEQERFCASQDAAAK